jgi:MYXO-CTERM domain-containing protein
MRVLVVAILSAALAAAAGPARAIVGGLPTAAFKPVGVGVQVTADWVLTVNHAALGVGDVYTNGYGSRTVLARYDAPGSGVFPANDLSLLRLAPADVMASTLPVSSSLFGDGSFPALAVTISSPANSGAGRGYAFATVTEFDTLVDPDDAGPLGPVVANYLVSLDSVVHVEGGDSGGGLFLGQVADSTSPLLGLTSAELTDVNNLPIGSGFVLLAAYRPWIDQTLAADPADSQAVLWVSTVPEPTALVLWAAGLLALAARRRHAG